MPRSRRVRSLNPSSDSAAAGRERRYDALRRRERRNPGSESARNPTALCYDAGSGQLVGDPSSRYYGLEVELAELYEEKQSVLVRHAMLPADELIVSLCPDAVLGAPTDLTTELPPPPAEPPGWEVVPVVDPGLPGPGDLVAELPGPPPHPPGRPTDLAPPGLDVPPPTGPGDRVVTPPGDPTVGCCIDEQTGVITCPGGTTQWYMHGRTVPNAALGCYDGESGRLCVITTGDATFTLPVCAPPTEEEPPDLTGCCVDEQTGLITCPGGTEQWYMHGRTVPAVTMACYDAEDGSRRCNINMGDNYLDVPVCPSVEEPPQLCCYDVASGTLRCNTEGGYDGLEVSLVSMQPQADGSIVAVVTSDELDPSTMTFPICDDPVVDCCYDATSETLVCPGSELDGTSAGIVVSWTAPDGSIHVWAAWKGGAARMPLCPGTTECPPVFCCINMQTMTYVCPGQPDLNGQPASIADLITEDGYSWGVLTDGTRIPMCGKQCPPPQLCPDCPTCPPGQWMSPDGTCHEPPECPPEKEPCPPGMWRDPTGACVSPPECPTCPPGSLLNTQTGQCVKCPPTGACPYGTQYDAATGRCVPCPEDPCCVGCAGGGPCKAEIPRAARSNPGGVYDRRGKPRKRRILSGNR